jgi:hypothetical protein
MQESTESLRPQRTMISFGGPTPNFHNAVRRICKESEKLEFFDNIIGFTDLDLKKDETFWNTHGSFIENNRRGYGYWLWKSYLTHKVLTTLKENDILVYCDAGCQINPHGKERLLEYVKMLNESKREGVISFLLPHKEVIYTKKALFDYFSMDCMDSETQNLLQNMATVIIIKKNEHSDNFISKWYQTCCNYDLINDTRENELNVFNDHRHDQSVFSMLVHQQGSIEIPDETYFHPNWEKGNNYPFLAKRMRY